MQSFDFAISHISYNYLKCLIDASRSDANRHSVQRSKTFERDSRTWFKILSGVSVRLGFVGSFVDLKSFNTLCGLWT